MTRWNDEQCGAMKAYAHVLAELGKRINRAKTERDLKRFDEACAAYDLARDAQADYMNREGIKW